MKNLTVLISGRQGSGKSKLAESLRNKIFRREIPNTYVELVSFAGPLYELHDMLLEYMEKRGFLVPMKDGPLLQYLGTDWGRKNFGENVWVDLLKKHIQQRNDGMNESFFPMNRVFIISDCRFPNELIPGSLKIRLECPAEIRKARILNTPGQSWRENLTHPSETSLDYFDGWDMVIDTEIHDAEFVSTLVVNRIREELK